MLIRAFQHTDIEAVKKFTDIAVGQGYYSLEELIENQKKAIAKNGDICSFVLVDETDNSVHGLRLAYPPGNWDHGKGSQLRPELWPTKIEDTAYFQSLFVSPELQGQGWGPQLAERSIEVFRKIGAKGIVAHCWKESPNNSSLRYLQNIGFKTIVEHPLYWINVNYQCTRDGYPCRCTAIEMHKSLKS
jgi:ribosomal protein S18 acetylase RimI-like enzyme